MSDTQPLDIGPKYYSGCIESIVEGKDGAVLNLSRGYSISDLQPNDRVSVKFNGYFDDQQWSVVDSLKQLGVRVSLKSTPRSRVQTRQLEDTPKAHNYETMDPLRVYEAFLKASPGDTPFILIRKHRPHMSLLVANSSGDICRGGVSEERSREVSDRGCRRPSPKPLHWKAL